ncbi:DUF3726 domain-containing protein [Halocynthiibacter namhaensis]|uniref:DUF3726 domain-containing protein n=1 Tax=Halocynthiibacter namhaensis TaxID=1290553 RepID=UPI0005793938|nr:DUF3726 domain-containing protein [Halocynthiibacter namhaensis]
MSHSLNEIEAMSKRAARGAGLAWGLAEEAAKGTRWLAGFGYPGPDLLADLLELNDRLPAIDFSPSSLNGTWRAPAGRMSPLISGAAMSDCAMRMLDGQVITIEQVSHPLLIVPFASGAALRLGVGVAVEWGGVGQSGAGQSGGGVRLTTDGKQLCVQGSRDEIMTAHAREVRCSAPAQMTSPNTPITRAHVDDTCWERLGAFAHRTYAPATEASRILGAGAGLNDND